MEGGTWPWEFLGWQYSGHLLSHLCQNRTNRTKQTRLPTAWEGSTAGKQLRSEGPLSLEREHPLSLRHCTPPEMLDVEDQIVISMAWIWGCQWWTMCWMTSDYVVFEFVGTLCTENLGRDIVDTYFHASRFSCTTWPNKHHFLLHEGNIERAFRANSLQGLICTVWLTRWLPLLWYLRLTARGDSFVTLSSRPQTGGGRLADLGPSYGYTCLSGLYWLGIGSSQAVLGGCISLACSQVEHLVVLAMKEGCGLLADS